MRIRLLRLLRLHDATPAERQATLWTGAFFFCVLASYYMLRPLRDEVGTGFDRDKLVGLFGLTFVMIVLLNQPYMALANRLPTARLLPIVLHGFAASFVAYGILFRLLPPHDLLHVPWSAPESLLGATFYSWVTSFAVCGVTLVWVHAVDHFTTLQGKRLFGLVSVGGTLGAIFGSALDLVLTRVSMPNEVLIAMAAAWLELGLVCYRRSRRACELMVAEHGGRRDTRRIAEAGVWRGLALVLRSPFLAGIAGFVLLSSLFATVFYYQLNGLAKLQIPGREDRNRLFAAINLTFNLLSLVIQSKWTAPALLRIGLAAVLCAMPLVTLLGLSVLAVLPAVGTMAVIEVVRRMMQFAFDKPAREVLFTPLDLEAKYKSKAFIDTTVLRLGDLLGAGVVHLVREVALPTLTIAATPVLAAWALLGTWLGRQCQRLKAAAEDAQATVPKVDGLPAAEASD